MGYLDRFVGIVEDDFSKFSSWGDPAAAEYEALSIPQHRIEYFKYRGVKVWDKKERLDEVFGSTSANSVGILKFMADVNADLGEEGNEGRCNVSILKFKIRGINYCYGIAYLFEVTAQ